MRGRSSSPGPLTHAPRGRGRDEKDGESSSSHRRHHHRRRSHSRDSSHHGHRSRRRSHSRSRSRSRSPRARSRSASPRRSKKEKEKDDTEASSSRHRHKRRRSHSTSSSSSSSDGGSRHRHVGHKSDRKKHKHHKHRRSSHSRERRERKRAKKEKKKGKGAVTEWGQYGIISETDIYNKEDEFRAWLIEEKMVNRETLSKDQEKKLFAQFVEDFNTATLPHEKYYNMAKYDARMNMVRNGELLPQNDSYDPNADLRAHASTHKRAVVEHDSFLSKDQLLALRKVQNERIEAGKMKVLGLEVKNSMGVRMDGSQFDPGRK